MAAPAAAVRTGAAAPEEPVEAALALPAPVTCATCTPYWVAVVTEPEIVVVTTLVAVVLAVHPAHVVQGADVLQGPFVHPGQSLPGQALPPHQLVQAPLLHAEFVLQ